MRFFTEAPEGVGFMHAATIMPAIAGAKTPGIEMKEVRPIIV
jgi:hypothetical protein